MNESTTEARSVIIERELQHPPEKVWRALTQGALPPCFEPGLPFAYQDQQGARQENQHRLVEVAPQKPAAFVVFQVGAGLFSSVDRVELGLRLEIGQQFHSGMICPLPTDGPSVTDVALAA